MPVQPPPGQAVGQLQWKADYTQSTAKAAGYLVKPGNRNPPAPPNPPWPPITIGPAGSPPPGGSVRCLEFALPAATTTERYEVEPNHRHFADGDDAWFGFAFYLTGAFPLADKGWQVIWQLHGEPTTGSPPVSFLAQRNKMWIDGGWGRPGAQPPDKYAYQFELMPITTGVWYSCVCHVVFNSTPNQGAVSLWVNGDNRLCCYAPLCGTNYTFADGTAGQAYLKNGVYRAPTVPGGGSIYFAAQSLGTGYGAVDPLNF
jgi:Polysaccharide lyase